MSIDFTTVLAILAMAVATIFTRLSGLVLVRYVTFSGNLSKAIGAIPPAVLMAVIAPTAFATGIAETVACAVTAFAALRLPMLVSVVLGVVSVAGLRAFGF